MPDGSPRYRERLWPPPWLFFATALSIPAALIVFLPIDVRVGILAAIVLYSAIVAVLLGTTPLIRIDDEELQAGRARLPLDVIGGAAAFRGADAVAERGVHLDARAWTLFRGWISPVVRIELDDRDDPTPYWLVSTRHPERIVAALSVPDPSDD